MVAALLTACDRSPPEPSAEEVAAVVRERVGSVLDRSLDRIQAYSDSLDEILQPVPFLVPAERAALRRYLQAEHLTRARALGVRPADRTEQERMVADGRLVVLADSTEHWVLRRPGRSTAVVTPSTRVLLALIGERFQQRLEAMGLPAYRFEITSVFRTAEDQAALRIRNPNAAAGTSTHEFGTTVDVSYRAFSAPAEARLEWAPAEPWLEPYLRVVADRMTERVAGRRSGELQAILGGVLRQMQDEGLVMVTLEEQQPVYHLTVADDLSTGN
jgi:hypothetical protein